MRDVSDMNPSSDGGDTELYPDAKGLRWLRRRLASGVAVITTVVDGSYRGATVTSHAPVSTVPPMLLVSVEAESQMAGWLRDTGKFALNVLARDQQFYADQFAGFTPLASSTFRDIDHLLTESGMPVLAGGIGWADCDVVATFDTGDHTCFVGEIRRLGAGTGDETTPLLYYLSRYRGLAPDTRRRT
ncbi:MAG: flavin reductase family protein [Chloroflexota bacterium]